MKLWKAMVVMVLAAFFATACGSEDGFEEDSLVPRVKGLSQTDLTVGQTVYVAGRNFLPHGEGTTQLEFNGFYHRDDGVLEEASFVIRPLYDGEFQEDGKLGTTPVEAGTRILRWSRFGPFDVPFSADGNQTGTFKGTLTARNLLADGTELLGDEETDITIRVRPSIIIRRLEPFVGFTEDKEPIYAECGDPALRALHKLPYVLEVEAIGFTPEFFMYEFRGINGAGNEAVKFTHPATGNTDSIGDPASKQLLVFDQVPEDQSRYYAAIRITATLKDTDGEYVETALPISVHRPMEFHMETASSSPAEYYEPVAVSGCIPGSLNNQVTYQESKSEARQNSVSVALSASWNTSHSDSKSADWSEGIGESHTVTTGESQNWSHSESETASEAYGVSYDHSEGQSATFTSDDGETWGWSYDQGSSEQQMESTMGELYGEVSSSVNVEVSAEGSVPGFAKVGGKVGTTVGASVGGKSGQTQGQTVGVSVNNGSNMSSSHNESEGYGSTTTDSVGESVNQSYALTAQDQVGGQTSSTNADQTSVVYNFGESTSSSDVVSVGEQETWQETWVTTETNTTLMSYSGKIPLSRYGVWYRQTVRYVREAQVYSYDLCGTRELMGSLSFNEWAWSPALALGDECGGSTMPRPALPDAGCVDQYCR